ncbi:MAG: hypothetical protein ACRENK_11835 [Gemmatimonadaceae bacterium]
MKKFLFIISLGAIFPLAAYADASSTINISDGMIAAIWAQAQDIFSGTQSYTTMIIGVILALLVIGELIHMLRKPNS